MRDTARPQPSSSRSRSRRVSSPHVQALSRRALTQHNAALNQHDNDDGERREGEEESVNNSSTDGTSSQFPWGTQRARSGRALKDKEITCSNREVALAVSLTATAWITGEGGLDWLLWPEEDPHILGECILHCWDAVEKQQEMDGYESHPLEDIIARKVSLTYFCILSGTVH